MESCPLPHTHLSCAGAGKQTPKSLLEAMPLALLTKLPQRPRHPRPEPLRDAFLPDPSAPVTSKFHPAPTQSLQLHGPTQPRPSPPPAACPPSQPALCCPRNCPKMWSPISFSCHPSPPAPQLPFLSQFLGSTDLSSASGPGTGSPAAHRPSRPHHAPRPACGLSPNASFSEGLPISLPGGQTRLPPDTLPILELSDVLLLVDCGSVGQELITQLITSINTR